MSDPATDPQLARMIDNDKRLRGAMGTLTDFAHATRQELLTACDTIEELSVSPSLLNRAKTMRQLTLRTTDTAAASAGP